MSEFTANEVTPTHAVKTGEPSEAGYKVHWFATLWMIGMHGMAISCAFTSFTWTGLIVCTVLYFVTGMLGITIGFHRLLTHRAFKAPKWLTRVLATCGTLSLQGGPMQWVARHRMHHSGVDTDLDPHNAKRGFWHSHIGWILQDRAMFDDEQTLRKFARDVASDPYMAWLSTTFGQTFVQLVIGVALLSIWGFDVFAYGFFVRIVLLYHSTWAVNSLTHLYGYRSFETADDSRNNWLVALVAFGEGWHNNHHAHPDVAPNGKRWFEFDLSWQVIKIFRALGWVSHVKTWDNVRDRADAPAMVVATAAR